jgi:serine/threonine-protein kinase
VFWQVADGGGELEQLTSGEYAHVPSSFSPDGQLLAFYEINPVTRRDIWVLRLNERKAEPFLATPADEVSPKFSPDGRWLAYESDESGQPEIYVRAYPGPGGRFQISSEGGREAAWNPNGRELFYRNGNRMMAVEITTQPTLVAGKPRMLFEGYVFGVVNGSYDVSADGERFLMLKEGEETAPATQINVVLNWFDELKRLVPVPTR